MVVEERSPTPVAELARLLGGADEIAEHDGCEDAVDDRLGPSSGEKGLDPVSQRIDVAAVRKMLPGLLEVLRARDVRGKVAAEVMRFEKVVGPGHHERRDGDRREDRPHVGRSDHLDHRADAARARGAALDARHLGTRPLVGRPLLREELQAGAGAPFGGERLHQRLDRVEARVARLGQPLRERAVQRQRERALRVGRGEHDAHRAAFGHAEQRCPFRADGVHHDPHILHAFLERRRPDHSLGQTGPPLVETNESREGRESAEEAGHPWLLPLELEVADQSWNPNEVEGPVAQHLIGNREITAPRVPYDWSFVGHHAHVRGKQLLPSMTATSHNDHAPRKRS